MPAYEALEPRVGPETVGSVADEVPRTTLDEAEAAIVAELGRRFELVDAELDPRRSSSAAELEADRRHGSRCPARR